MSEQTKYVIDSNVIIELIKERGRYSKDVHVSLFGKINDYVQRGIIVSASDVYEELKDDPDPELKMWLIDNKKIFLEINAAQIVILKKILTKYPFLGEGFKDKADPVLVSLSVHQSLTLITLESSKINASPIAPKIPNLCEEFGASCVDVNGFCRQERIQL